MSTASRLRAIGTRYKLSMKVQSILHASLGREVIAKHAIDLSLLPPDAVMRLKEADRAILSVLDECSASDMFTRYPSIYALAQSPKRLTALRTYLNYSYKVKVSASKQQIQEAQKGFLERNKTNYEWTKANYERLVKVVRGRYSDSESDFATLLIGTARRLCHHRLSSYRTPRRPAHGPGVASNCSRFRIAKYESLWRDVPASLRRFSEWFVPSPSFAKEFAPMGWDSVAKLRAVPKDMRGPRLIAPHSVSHMWIQQAVSDRICNILVNDQRWMKIYPLTGELVSTIQFDEQAYNQGLAVFSSAYPQLYSTLDLSDASDRVPWSLVQAILPRTVVADLAACRARYIEIDGIKHKVHMHAPMGSACCFPILSLVVWSLCCASILLREPRARSLDVSPASVRSVYVFGDDVVLPRYSTESVASDLSLVNLRVNKAKSFAGIGGFRESCGYDAYNGTVITPLRLRVDGVSSADDLLSLIAHANALEDNGFTDTALVCRSLIKRCAHEIGCSHLIGATIDKLYTNSLHFENQESCKAWNLALNVTGRWNRALQRHEIRVLQFSDQYNRVDSTLDGRSRLFEALLGKRAPHQLGWVRKNPRLAVTWIPTWAPRK